MTDRQSPIVSISAVTLATHDMARSFEFYTSLGFEIHHGGPEASFTSYTAGDGFLNVIAQPADKQWSWWGRLIIYVSDPDDMYQRATAAGLSPEAPPRDAEWGERYFHISDPDKHELSFATPLPVT